MAHIPRLPRTSTTICQVCLTRRVSKQRLLIQDPLLADRSLTSGDKDIRTSVDKTSKMTLIGYVFTPHRLTQSKDAAYCYSCRK